jgi:cell division protein FtsB
LFLILACIVALLVAFSYARAYYQDFAIRQEISRLESEVNRLEYKKLESFELLKYVSSDAYVEEKGRVEFNLKKPGEQVLVIPEETTLPGTGTTSQENQDKDLKNPVKWWYYFLHKDISNT